MKAIYIHIPFCVRKCLYCDFVSGPPDGPVFPFVESLGKEIREGSRLYDDGEPVTSIFFGGGTPTFLPAEDLIFLLDTVRNCFPVSNTAEISFECNPGTLSSDSASRLKRAGFNRVSLGLQSSKDRLLKLIGRIHNLDDFLKAFQSLREAGFDNINVDVMHALPTQSIAEYIDTLSLVCELAPEHVSSYSLILEEKTPFFAMVGRGELVLPDEDLAADMQDAGITFLREHGYVRYEISNFSKKGYECRHNLLYWDNGDYLGFGPAAHSSYPIHGKRVRWHNVNNTNEYIQRMNVGENIREEMTVVDECEQRFESVMLGLRKTSGLDNILFKKRFGLSVTEAFPLATEWVRKNGLIDIDNEYSFSLNSRGLDILNSVLLHFME